MRYGQVVLAVLAVLATAAEVHAQGIIEGKPCVIEGPLRWQGGQWMGPNGPAFPARAPQVGRPIFYSVPLPQVGATRLATAGALVLSVDAHGAAGKARVDAGDRIVAINYEAIRTSEDYYRLIESGKRVTLSVQDGQTGRIRRRVVMPEAGRIGIQFVVR